jgi:hypothetical protein
VTIEQGDAAGLIFGFQKEESFHLFEFCRVTATHCVASTAKLLQMVPIPRAMCVGPDFPICQTTSSSININAGQANELTVISLRNVVYLYINAHFFASLPDVTASGKIGVIAYEDANPTDVVFRSAKVWKIES